MSEEPAIWINSAAFWAQARAVDHAALSIAMDLVMLVYMPGRHAFTWDAAGLANAIKRPDTTALLLDAHRDEVSRFFTVLDDGRWVPSPEYFSLTDGNADRSAH